MAYSDFKTVAKVKTDFDLVTAQVRLFSDVSPIEPSEYLRLTLQRNLKVAFDNDTDKARSELIIAPLLIEIREICDEKISLFSGREFNVDAARGLTGYCDYLIAASEFSLEIEAPVITIAEAKNESTNSGLGQCIAEMIAAQSFNRERNTPIETIYGAVTTGRLWRFLKLVERTVSIDTEELAINDAEDKNVGKVLGILAAPLQHLCNFV